MDSFTSAADSLVGDASAAATHELVVSGRLPIEQSPDTRLHVVARPDGSDQYVVVEHGSALDADVPLVRVHSACLTGDLFGSVRCDCGPQLAESLAQICAADWGMLVYACEHEGRGIGLAAKIRAYCLQDVGLDTFEANVRLGLPEDAREYVGAAAALRLLGAETVDLLSSNPAKACALEAAGVKVRAVRRLDLESVPTNARYLEVKRERFASARAAMGWVDPPVQGPSRVRLESTAS
jgi:3,4-dihydroxy 2-butanone 4-phosphate synthase/GTP cyclohydrolase II